MWSRPDVGWAVSIGSAATCRGTRTWRAGAPGSTSSIPPCPSCRPRCRAALSTAWGSAPSPTATISRCGYWWSAPRRGAPGPGSSRSTWRATSGRPLDAADGADLAQFAQITMELHDLHQLSDTSAGPRIVRVLRKLWATHLPVHVHANNYARVVKFGAYWFPDTIEASWVRRDFLPDATPVERLNTSLDRPCDPRTSDVDLTGILVWRRRIPPADAARRLRRADLPAAAGRGCVALLRRARRPVRHRTVRRPAQAAVPSGLEPARPGRPARASAHRRLTAAGALPDLLRAAARRRRPSAGVDLVHHTFYHPRFLRDFPGIPKVITIYDLIPELLGGAAASAAIPIWQSATTSPPPTRSS